MFDSSPGGMFGALGGELSMAPTPDDLDKARLEATRDRSVKIKGHHVVIFDLEATKDRKAYETLMPKLMVGIADQTITLHVTERHILTRKDGSQGWFIYLEYSEFELTDVPVTPVKSASAANQ